jgi:F-type H+-transporting ATPase subunit b
MIVAANPLIDLQAGLMIWTLICFGITFYVLKRFAFGPIQQAIDQRRDRIRESLAEADKAREDARKLLEEHKQLRASARGEAEEILSEARRIADSMQERTRAEIDEDRQRRLEETKRQIEAETARSIEMIRSEVADLAITAAEKVTRKSLDDGDHRRLIEEAIGDLDFSALERQEATR